MLLFGMGICLDSFLWTMAILPFRVLLFFLAVPFRIIRKTEIKIFFLEKVALLICYFSRFQVNFFRLVFILGSWFVVSHVEVSTFAMLVKQSELKLKMIWMFLEFLDLVLKRYGVFF